MVSVIDGAAGMKRNPLHLIQHRRLVGGRPSAKVSIDSLSFVGGLDFAGLTNGGGLSSFLLPQFRRRHYGRKEPFLLMPNCLSGILVKLLRNRNMISIITEMETTGEQQLSYTELMAIDDGKRHLFTEKLSRLCEARVKSAVDRLAGLREGSVAVWIKHGVLPPPFATLKLAQALQVDLEWLIDEDDPSLDPPTPKTTAAARRELADRRLQEIPHEELIGELARRLAEKLAILNKMIDDADRAAWEEAAINLWSRGLGVEPDGNSKRLLDAGVAVDQQVDAVALSFNIQTWQHVHSFEHYENGTEPPDVVTIDDIENKWDLMQLRRPGLAALLMLDKYLTFPRDMNAPAGPGFLGDYAVPVVLSHLVTHERVANNPNREGIREKLRKDGYIGKDGQPTHPLPWLATDEQTQRMIEEFERQRRKRK